MEIKMKAKTEKYLYWVLCVLTLAAAVFPGIFRVSETAGVISRSGLLLCMIQVGTLLTSMMCFRSIFKEAETRLSTYFGVLLYMTCPYRIYICYDLTDIAKAAAWMLLPLYVWALTEIMGQRKVLKIVIAGVALAGIGYMDVLLLFFLAALTVVASVVFRKKCFLLPVILGTVLALNRIMGFGMLVFGDIFYDTELQIKSIMANGYRFGEYFQSYDYKEGHPGMGLGMLICLLSAAWLAFVKGVKEEHKSCKFLALTAGFLTALSFYLFPWDVVQRLGSGALRLVSAIDTPAVFWGWALACLCVPAACAMDRISKEDNKLIAIGVPVTVILACLGVCIYQCGNL